MTVRGCRQRALDGYENDEVGWDIETSQSRYAEVHGCVQRPHGVLVEEGIRTLPAARPDAHRQVARAQLHVLHVLHG